MPPHRRIAARDAALTGLALLVVACGDTTNLPAPIFANVVLVDDVLTSGATANAAARALLRGGAKSVDVLVFSRVVTSA